MQDCRRWYVKGHVQGVFFRAATREMAQKLFLNGYAANLPDGRVEVVACGDPEDLDALEEWLRDGPPQARVDALIEADRPNAEGDGFRIA